jgi:toxin ParE1/3/4
VKPLTRRELADSDVLEAIDDYLAHAPEAVPGFIDALERAYRHIQSQPGSGSPRYAHELNLPGLRFLVCEHYPYLVFYMEHEQRIDVWRVLHARRDIPSWLQAGET